MARECPDGQCVIAQTEHFLAVLKDPKADRAAKAEALRFVVHLVGDLHQPLHDEDDHDKGGRTGRRRSRLTSYEASRTLSNLPTCSLVGEKLHLVGSASHRRGFPGVRR
jgi:hypothetical protein